MENCNIKCLNIGCPVPSFIQQHEAFLLTLIASTSACLGLVFSYLLKSRCIKINACCIKCERTPLPVDEFQSVT